jgi:hypothetical protein
MTGKKMVWTPEMVATLRSMRAQGWRLALCAERVGVSIPTAVLKAHELGIAGRLRKPGPLDKNRK